MTRKSLKNTPNRVISTQTARGAMNYAIADNEPSALLPRLFLMPVPHPQSALVPHLPRKCPHGIVPRMCMTSDHTMSSTFMAQLLALAARCGVGRFGRNTTSGRLTPVSIPALAQHEHSREKLFRSVTPEQSLARNKGGEPHQVQEVSSDAPGRSPVQGKTAWLRPPCAGRSQVHARPRPG